MPWDLRGGERQVLQMTVKKHHTEETACPTSTSLALVGALEFQDHRSGKTGEIPGRETGEGECRGQTRPSSGPFRPMAAFNGCLPQSSLPLFPMYPYISHPGYFWGSPVSLGFCDKDRFNESRETPVSWLRSLGRFWLACVVSGKEEASQAVTKRGD